MNTSGRVFFLVVAVLILVVAWLKMPDPGLIPIFVGPPIVLLTLIKLIIESQRIRSGNLTGDSRIASPYHGDKLQLERARRIQEQTKETDLGRVLEQLGIVGKRKVIEAKAAEMGYPFVDLDRIRVDPSAHEGVPIELMKTHRMLPVKREGFGIWAAFASIGDLAAQDALRDATGCRVYPCMCDPEELDKKLAELVS